MIEQILNRFRGQDELGGVLQALVDWWSHLLHT
jgi:hypothetical protein